MAENCRAQPTECSDAYTQRQPRINWENNLRLKRVSLYLYIMRFSRKEFGLINSNIIDQLGQLIITLMMMMMMIIIVILIIIIIPDILLPFLKAREHEHFQKSYDTRKIFTLLFIPSRKKFENFLKFCKDCSFDLFPICKSYSLLKWPNEQSGYILKNEKWSSKYITILYAPTDLAWWTSSRRFE